MQPDTASKILYSVSSTAEVDRILTEEELVLFAKELLIEYQGMTEPEAHKYLQKTAMDRRVSKKYIAKWVVTRYVRK